MKTTVHKQGYINEAIRLKDIAENMISDGNLIDSLWILRDACDYALYALDINPLKKIKVTVKVD